MHGTESVNDLNEVAVISCIIFSKETLSAVLQLFFATINFHAHSLHATVQYLRDTTRRQKAYFSAIAKDLRWNYFCRRVPSFISDRVINMAPNRLLSAGINLLKVNNRNTIKRCEICSKVRIKTPERHHVAVVSLLILNIFHTLL